MNTKEKFDSAAASKWLERSEQEFPYEKQIIEFKERLFSLFESGSQTHDWEQFLLKGFYIYEIIEFLTVNSFLNHPRPQWKLLQRRAARKANKKLFQVIRVCWHGSQRGQHVQGYLSHLECRTQFVVCLILCMVWGHSWRNRDLNDKQILQRREPIRSSSADTSDCSISSDPVWPTSLAASHRR